MWDKSELYGKIIYCKFTNFCKNFIFANKDRNICDVNNWRPGHDLPSSANGMVNL